MGDEVCLCPHTVQRTGAEGELERQGVCSGLWDWGKSRGAIKTQQKIKEPQGACLEEEGSQAEGRMSLHLGRSTPLGLVPLQGENIHRYFMAPLNVIDYDGLVDSNLNKY